LSAKDPEKKSHPRGKPLQSRFPKYHELFEEPHHCKSAGNSLTAKVASIWDSSQSETCPPRTLIGWFLRGDRHGGGLPVGGTPSRRRQTFSLPVNVKWFSMASGSPGLVGFYGKRSFSVTTPCTRPTRVNTERLAERETLLHRLGSELNRTVLNSCGNSIIRTG
jgi:hypothetical protein